MWREDVVPVLVCQLALIDGGLSALAWVEKKVAWAYLHFPLDYGARQIELPLWDSDPAFNQQSDHDLEKYTGN